MNSFTSNENIERIPVSVSEMASILFNEKRDPNLMPLFYYRIAMNNKAKLLNGEKFLD